MANPAGAQRLQTTFANAPITSHPQRWDELYRDSYSPWDRAGPSPALADLLTQRPDLVPPAQERDARGNPLRTPTGAVSKRTALVPGCGRGHDVILLARLGYDVWGLDSSETAITAARENEREARGGADVLRPLNEDVVESGKVTWVTANFFSDDWSKDAGTDGTGQFDLVFDYTVSESPSLLYLYRVCPRRFAADRILQQFFCALPISARPQWAGRICSLTSSKGRLVCLEFPSGKPLSQNGPPWGVSPEVYEAYLAAPGDPVDYSDNGSVISTPSPKPRDHGLHRLSLIKPARTHAAGTNEDGSVQDFISIWSR